MRYNRDLEYFGKNIIRSIQDAVETGDFTSLSQNVRDAVDSALGGRSRYRGRWYRPGNRGRPGEQNPSKGGMGDRLRPDRRRTV